MPETTGKIEDPTKVWLGNRAAIEVVDDPGAPASEDGSPARTRRPIPVAKACSVFVARPGLKLFQTGREITEGFWPNVSDDEAPAWVASTDPKLAELLSEHWGGIEVREPENPDVLHGPYVFAEPQTVSEAYLPRNSNTVEG